MTYAYTFAYVASVCLGLYVPKLACMDIYIHACVCMHDYLYTCMRMRTCSYSFIYGFILIWVHAAYHIHMSTPRIFGGVLACVHASAHASARVQVDACSVDV